MGYIENIHDKEKIASKIFIKGWNRRIITLFKQMARLDDRLIAKVTSMKMEGVKFFRGHKLYDNVIKIFPKDEAKKELVKMNKTYFSLYQVNNFWCKIFKVVMEYVTIDGRFTKIYSYHFVLLNHFRHSIKIYFPYYLMCSLNDNLANHIKNPKVSPLAHQGLILLIYEHFEARANRIQSQIQDNDREYLPNNDFGNSAWEDDKEVHPPTEKIIKTSKKKKAKFLKNKSHKNESEEDMEI